MVHTNIRSLKLDGKVFVVTGGARGLGLTLAEALVEAGARGMLPLVVALEREAHPVQYTA